MLHAVCKQCKKPPLTALEIYIYLYKINKKKITLPFPSLVLAFLIWPDGEICWIFLIQMGGATLTVSTAAATAAATAVAEVPLKGLFALNSRHFAPRTVIIFDMGILGFFLAMRGLTTGKKGFVANFKTINYKRPCIVVILPQVLIVLRHESEIGSIY